MRSRRTSGASTSAKWYDAPRRGRKMMSNGPAQGLPVPYRLHHHSRDATLIPPDYPKRRSSWSARAAAPRLKTRERSAQTAAHSSRRRLRHSPWPRRHRPPRPRHRLLPRLRCHHRHLLRPLQPGRRRLLLRHLRNTELRHTGLRHTGLSTAGSHTAGSHTGRLSTAHLSTGLRSTGRHHMARRRTGLRSTGLHHMVRRHTGLRSTASRRTGRRP